MERDYKAEKEALTMLNNCVGKSCSVGVTSVTGRLNNGRDHILVGRAEAKNGFLLQTDDEKTNATLYLHHEDGWLYSLPFGASGPARAEVKLINGIEVRKPKKESPPNWVLEAQRRVAGEGGLPGRGNGFGGRPGRGNGFGGRPGRGNGFGGRPWGGSRKNRRSNRRTTRKN